MRVITWVSTNMAMSMNISCSSRMLVSSFMMSLWRDSISFRACLVICESDIIFEKQKQRRNTDELKIFLEVKEKKNCINTNTHGHLALTSDVKMEGFPLSSISSSSSSVVVFPAKISTRENSTQYAAVFLNYPCVHKLAGKIWVANILTSVFLTFPVYFLASVNDNRN